MLSKEHRLDLEPVLVLATAPHAVHEVETAKLLTERVIVMIPAIQSYRVIAVQMLPALEVSYILDYACNELNN